MSAAITENRRTFFIEIRAAERKNATITSAFASLRDWLKGNRISLDEIWVGDDVLVLKVRSEATGFEREDLLEKVKSHPLVSQVVSAEMAHIALRHLSTVQKFDGNALISEGRLRGFVQKRRNFKPTTQAPHTGEILVKYLEEAAFSEPTLSAARDRVAQLHSKNGARVKGTHRSEGRVIEVVETVKNVDLEAVIQSYEDSEDVEYAQPNYEYSAQVSPNDFDDFLGWHLTKISCPDGWGIRNDASDVIVAVVDTGIDYNHPDLVDNMWVNPAMGALGNYDGYYGADFVGLDSDPMDDSSGYTIHHGTHCAGLIGARGNNGLGIPGVAWRVKLMAVKVLDSAGFGTSISIAAGLDYARTKGAKIVNASWTLGPWTSPGDSLIQESLLKLRQANVVFVNAAGNDGLNTDITPIFPCNFGLPNMVVVNGSDGNDVRFSSSNYGKWSSDVFAPGSGIYSTLPFAAYGHRVGTSRAAALTSGVLALAKAQFPWESATELADRIRFSVDPVSSLTSQCMSGGRINLAKALGSRPRFVGLSTRCQVTATAHGLGIGGFWITGPNSKRVLLRALGPSLGGSGFLQDPMLLIYNQSGQLIGQNTDWINLNQADKYELAAAGLTPSHSSECAWIGTLPPGGYTGAVIGVGSANAGVALVESWDIDGSTISRLVNTSTRCFVGTGSQAAVATIRISGDKARQIFVRALGPSLANFGITGALQDPVISLFNSSNVQIFTNDNWRDFDGSSNSLETRLLSTYTPPNHELESAVLARLQPGTYTIRLSGKNNGTGIGLIECNEY